MISVIVPVYNAEKYIVPCINSILNQTYQQFQLILVDDGSSDNSLKLCKAFESDLRVRVISKQNGGVSSARYEGILASTGEYITFVDNDDILAPEFLEQTMAYMEDNVDIVAASSTMQLSEKIEEFVKKKENQETAMYEYSGEEAAEAILDNVKCKIERPLWGKLYRKELLQKVQLEQYRDKIPILFWEDLFALNFLLIEARKVRFLNQVLYIQRAVGESLSRSGNLGNYYFNQVEAYHLLYQYLKGKNVPKATHRCLDEYDKCLERMWYKLKYDGVHYGEGRQVQRDIDEKYNLYYPVFKQTKIGVMRKIDLFLFKYARRLWEWTVGTFYFRVITGYKRKKIYRELSR